MTEKADADDWPCPDCGRAFSSYKGMRVHQTSHTTRPCQWCGDPYSLRGIERHEVWCEQQPRGSGANVMCPSPQWRSRLEDFLERAKSIPVGTFLVMADDFGPAFVAPRAAAARTFGSKGPTLVLAAELIPASILELPEVRFRRQDATWDRSEDARVEAAWEREDEADDADDGPIEVWPCPECGKYFDTQTGLRRHKAWHTTAPCAFCSTERPVASLAKHEGECPARAGESTTTEEQAA